MPASRSRTERWRDCLNQIHQRDGGLEISIPTLPQQLGPSTPDIVARHAGDLIWRVRVLSITDQEIWVECPSAAGVSIDLEPNVGIIAVMSIGQNRWMFMTQTIGHAGATHQGRPVKAIRLAMPEHVERCQRRNFYRVSTAQLTLPSVECWPILDPATVGAAEVANRAQILDLLDHAKSSAVYIPNEPAILPEVGPKFKATLMNIGGGGVGLHIEPGDAHAIDRARYLWLRIDLTPHIPAPIAMTARLAHTHIDSTQALYAGLAFEWAFNAQHRDFVVEQIRRYLLAVQRAQVAQKRQAA